MTIRMRRIYGSEWDTVGIIEVPGTGPIWTLEDEYRAVKVHGETRIPAGKYRLALRDSPKMTPRLGHKMLWLLDVPGFSYIYIHPIHTEADTDGCIGVGDMLRLNPFGPSEALESRTGYYRIYQKVAPMIENGTEEVYIEIIDQDRNETT